MSSQLLWHSLDNYGSGNVKKERAKDCIIYSVETQQNVKEWAISYNLIFSVLIIPSLYLFVIPAFVVMAVVGGIVKKQGELI